MAKEIPLTQGKVAIVDDADFEALAQFRWHPVRGYAARCVYRPERKTILMHRDIIDAPKGMDVDHIDGNPLNNQSSNLRVCSRSENQYNQAAGRRGGTSQYKGVSWHKRHQKWQAELQVNKKNVYLGLFVDEVDAARAYDKAAQKHFGEFARLNFPSDAEKARDEQLAEA